MARGSLHPSFIPQVESNISDTENHRTEKEMSLQLALLPPDFLPSPFFPSCHSPFPMSGQNPKSGPQREAIPGFTTFNLILSRLEFSLDVSFL